MRGAKFHIGARTRRRGVLLTTAVNASMLIIGVVTGVVTARGFEPDERGVFLAAVLWSATIATFSLLGLDQAVVYGAHGNWRQALTLSDVLRRRVLAQSAVGAVISFIVTIFISRSIGAQALLLAAIALLPVFFNGMTQLKLAPLLIAERYIAWNLARFLSSLSYVALLGGLTLFDRLTLLSALSAVALGSLASLVLATLATRGSATTRAGAVETVHLVKYGRQLLFITVPALLASRVDQLLMGLLASPATLGIYAVAVSVASVMEVPKQTIEQLAFPHFTREGWQQADVRLRGAGMTLLAILSSLALLFLSRPLIPIVYGDDYRAALDPLPWLLLAMALRVGAAVMGAAAKAAGQLGMMARSQGLGLILTLATLVVLLPQRGAQGAAEAVLLGQLASWLSMFQGLKRGGLTPRPRAEN